MTNIPWDGRDPELLADNLQAQLSGLHGATPGELVHVPHVEPQPDEVSVFEVISSRHIEPSLRIALGRMATDPIAIRKAERSFRRTTRGLDGDYVDGPIDLVVMTKFGDDSQPMRTTLATRSIRGGGQLFDSEQLQLAGALSFTTALKAREGQAVTPEDISTLHARALESGLGMVPAIVDIPLTTALQRGARKLQHPRLGWYPYQLSTLAGLSTQMYVDCAASRWLAIARDLPPLGAATVVGIRQFWRSVRDPQALQPTPVGHDRAVVLQFNKLTATEAPRTVRRLF